ncbi:MAG TPA: hypothetical protein VGR88_01225, partial [Ktedonobacterales bacterium]|nr:hypothetical protein [Ktedonobacterales bacterium]
MARSISPAETRRGGTRAEPTHSHSHQLSREKLRLGFYLTLLLLTVEIAGGLISHSLALLSD